MRLAGLAAALALAATSTGAGAQDAVISLAPGEVLLKVEAEGEHLSRPDVMEISAGVVTTGRNAKDALGANALLANRLLAAVRTAGIEARDVQTSQLAVTPQFERNDRTDEDEGGVRRITGYMARNQVRLRIRDLGRAADIVNALFEAGANEVQGPSFSLSNPAPALKEARRAAVAQARRQADTYAEALGMRIARVLKVSERETGSETMGFITVTGSRIQAAPLEPGEISTQVEVWIDYAMVPR